MTPPLFLGSGQLVQRVVEVPNKFLRRDFYVNGRRIQLTGGGMGARHDAKPRFFAL